MGIVELLTKIGDDRITFQNLDHDTLSANWTEKKGSRITFGSGVRIGPFDGRPGGDDKIGLVIWLPRAQVEEIIADARKEGT